MSLLDAIRRYFGDDDKPIPYALTPAAEAFLAPLYSFEAEPKHDACTYPSLCNHPSHSDRDADTRPWPDSATFPYPTERF